MASLAGLASASHALSTCSICQADSPKAFKPTMRELPFRVWKERRRVVSSALSWGAVRSWAIAAWPWVTTSAASSRKISSNSSSKPSMAAWLAEGAGLLIALLSGLGAAASPKLSAVLGKSKAMLASSTGSAAEGSGSAKSVIWSLVVASNKVLEGRSSGVVLTLHSSGVMTVSGVFCVALAALPGCTGRSASVAGVPASCVAVLMRPMRGLSSWLSLS